MYPQLRLLNIDDFSDVSNFDSWFPTHRVAQMVRLVRPAKLVPTMYYTRRHAVASSPVDGFLFYFRGEKTGSCASDCATYVRHGCAGKWPEGACLAGACAEASADNLPSEVRDVQQALRPGLPLYVGIYASGRETTPPVQGWDQWSCSTPSALYVALALEAALRLPAVEGTVVYRLRSIARPSPKQLAVTRIYGALDRERCPASAPFGYAGGALCCPTTAWIGEEMCDGDSACCTAESGCRGLPRCLAD